MAAVMAGLALAGAAFQTVGALAALEEKKQLARLHKREIDFQAKTSDDLFNFSFPNLVRQQRFRRGEQASQLAKRGVAFEGSALAQLSEQARIDSVNQSLTQFQHALNQRSFKIEGMLTNRSIRQAKTEQAFTLASGIISGTSGVLGAGGFS